MRVASVPAAHPYVRGLGLDEVSIVLLADPPVPGSPPGVWWPPVMLEPAWVAAHARDFDLLHLHFGAESLSLTQLRELLAALRIAKRPLVHTVHDLTHPQLVDQKHHEAQLGVLVSEADALITLTPGAADEIHARWGRTATVIPHPAMRAAIPARERRVARAPDSPFGPLRGGSAPGPLRGGCASDPIVGVHLRDLRPGIDGPGTVRALRDALAQLRADGLSVRGQVWLRERVRDPDAAAEVRRLVDSSAVLGLEAQPWVSDAALEAELGRLAVSLLPYRHGTHSGWLELCWDLGVPVAAPAIGQLAGQHADADFLRSFAPSDAFGLASALRALLAEPAARAGAPARAAARRARALERARLRPSIAAAHEAVYRTALSGTATRARGELR